MKKISPITLFIVFLASCNTAASNPILPSSQKNSASNNLATKLPNSSNVSTPVPLSTIPSGFSMVSYAGANPGGGFGSEVSMVLDENDEPLISYIDDTGNHEGIGVFFTRWNRNSNTWKTPLRVAEVDIKNSEVGARQLSIARDPKTGIIGIAFQKSTDHINSDPDISFIYSTNEGLSWSKEQRVGENHFNTDYGESNPSLAIYNNKVHIAFFSSWVRCQSGQCNAVIYATKDIRKNESFTYTTSPLLSDTGQNTTPLSLSLNSKGEPGIANYHEGKYNQNGDLVGPLLRVVYWEPEKNILQSIDSTNEQNDFRSISLAYNEDIPAVTYQLFKNSNLVPPNIWYATKSKPLSTGSLNLSSVNWNTPIAIPDDPSRNGGSWLSLAFSPLGIPSIAYEFSQGTSSTTCGAPLLVSYNEISGWSMCAPPKSADLPLSYMNAFSGDFMNLAYNKSGKRIMVFRQMTPSSEARLDIGVAIWKEF